MVTFRYKNHNRNYIKQLSFKIKVESSFESIDFDLAGEFLDILEWSGGDGTGNQRSDGLNGLSTGSRDGPRDETSLVTGKDSALLMGSIKRVDKRVDSSTISAIWYSGSIKLGRLGLGLGSRIFGLKFGSILIESKITMGGVMGVNEGVKVGVNNFFDDGGNAGSGDTCGQGYPTFGGRCGQRSTCRSRCGFPGGDFGTEWGRILPGS